MLNIKSRKEKKELMEKLIKLNKIKYVINKLKIKYAKLN